ncbi:hypothetical protein CWE21_01735 [Pseudidiomarina aquimaris]|uniref:Polyketide cyclase/dehydrase n=1 Tax=Pseudidiomarina aquimaris TaxID=641841 RepID=A0A432XQE4_9GAMM|nr:hypothetical protein [Pseudidiomarina aquimaris]RUO50841.1 hypothetical protein CWE21_01735 [Pseudidiomarina aquimaris]
MSMKIARISSLATVIACLLLPTATSKAETLDSSATGFTFAFSLPVDGHLKHVFEGLTEDIGAWWLADHTWYGKSENMTLQLRPGGCLCEIDSELRFTEHLRVVKVEPYSLIRFTGGLGPLQGEGVTGVMDWSLKNSADEQTTTLTVRYRVSGYSPNDLSAWAVAVENVLLQQMTSFQTYMNQ